MRLEFLLLLLFIRLLQDAEIVDLGPLLRDVPDVDPSVLLTLHRTPWAEDVCEGIRKQEACFEWQGKDR